MKKSLSSLLFAIILCLTLVGCGSSSKFTLNQFNKLQPGMSYAQTTEILKDKGQLTSETKTPAVPGFMDEIHVKAYSWQNPDGSNIIIMFQNDKLDTKAQVGLK